MGISQSKGYISVPFTINMRDTPIISFNGCSKISIGNVNAGDFFGSTPIFIYEDDPENGLLNIYSSFLGSDSSSTVSGTGNLATLVLGTITAGQSTLNYTVETQIVDAQDNPVVLNGLGEGVIDVQ